MKVRLDIRNGQFIAHATTTDGAIDVRVDLTVVEKKTLPLPDQEKLLRERAKQALQGLMAKL